MMRLLYMSYQPGEISESVIRKSGALAAEQKSESAIRDFGLQQLADRFPLSWTHYVRLMRRTRSAEERGVLRNGSPSGWLERTAARTADRQPVLYAHADVPKQARDARKWRGRKTG
ncbi:hypothetical protein [Paraburkholderia strydomiana]